MKRSSATATLPMQQPSPVPLGHRSLVLASGSSYRQALLRRLGVDFTVFSPQVDERPRPGEAPEALARRLAEAKARRAGGECPRALIIGCDQVAVRDGVLIGKPGDHAAAVRQLLAASGRTVRFLTALCLLNSESGRLQLDVVPYTVEFRPLDRATIEAYLERERPYDCAGAFKSEGLGIALAARLTGDDPTALIGLPLIRLTGMLAEEGLSVL